MVHGEADPKSEREGKERAAKRYRKLLSTVAEQELMVSGSDDFTLFLWNPSQVRNATLKSEPTCD